MTSEEDTKPLWTRKDPRNADYADKRRRQVVTWWIAAQEAMNHPWVRYWESDLHESVQDLELKAQSSTFASKALGRKEAPPTLSWPTSEWFEGSWEYRCYGKAIDISLWGHTGVTHGKKALKRREIDFWGALSRTHEIKKPLLALKGLRMVVSFCWLQKD